MKKNIFLILIMLILYNNAIGQERYKKVNFINYNFYNTFSPTLFKKAKKMQRQPDSTNINSLTNELERIICDSFLLKKYKHKFPVSYFFIEGLLAEKLKNKKNAIIYYNTALCLLKNNNYTTRDLVHLTKFAKMDGFYCAKRDTMWLEYLRLKIFEYSVENNKPNKKLDTVKIPYLQKQQEIYEDSLAHENVFIKNETTKIKKISTQLNCDSFYVNSLEVSFYKTYTTDNFYNSVNQQNIQNFYDSLSVYSNKNKITIDLDIETNLDVKDTIYKVINNFKKFKPCNYQVYENYSHNDSSKNKKYIFVAINIYNLFYCKESKDEYYSDIIKRIKKEIKQFKKLTFDKELLESMREQIDENCQSF